jgi:hypothetical protein
VDGFSEDSKELLAFIFDTIGAELGCDEIDEVLRAVPLKLLVELWLMREELERGNTVVSNVAPLVDHSGFSSRV